MSEQDATVARIPQEQLGEIVRRLVDAVSPLQIILFGSYLYGRPTEDSDLDLMVIVDDEGPDRFELSKRAYASLRGINIPIELHFCRVSTFRRFGAVVGSIQREVKERGRLVYAA